MYDVSCTNTTATIYFNSLEFLISLGLNSSYTLLWFANSVLFRKHYTEDMKISTLSSLKISILKILSIIELIFILECQLRIHFSSIAIIGCSQQLCSIVYNSPVIFKATCIIYQISYLHEFFFLKSLLFYCLILYMTVSFCL